MNSNMKTGIKFTSITLGILCYLYYCLATPKTTAVISPGKIDTAPHASQKLETPLLTPTHLCSNPHNITQQQRALDTLQKEIAISHQTGGSERAQTQHKIALSLLVGMLDAMAQTCKETNIPTSLGAFERHYTVNTSQE